MMDSLLPQRRTRETPALQSGIMPLDSAVRRHAGDRMISLEPPAEQFSEETLIRRVRNGENELFYDLICPNEPEPPLSRA